jgi:hypothetical protein
VTMPDTRATPPPATRPEQVTGLLGRLFPEEYATESISYGLGGSDRAVQHVTLHQGKQVDVALDLEHLWLGSWCRVARVDICRRELHLHHHRRGSTADYVTRARHVADLDDPWGATVDLCLRLFEQWNEEVDRWCR